MTKQQQAGPLSPEEKRIVADFHRLYLNRGFAGSGSLAADWRGFQAVKCPLDLWVYQELIRRRSPDLIVETGTFFGGSALYLADMCAFAANGHVISIDTKNGELRPLPVHERLTFVKGSSTDPDIVADVYARAKDAREVMVILDSDHFAVHVMAELEAYAPLIRPGGYLIVEDGVMERRPSRPNYRPGPTEATRAFLARHPEFEVDTTCERFLMTLNPSGYLRRRETP